jgi:DNA-binding beta-propeller fold protein YncE
MITAYDSAGVQQTLSGSFTGIEYPYGMAWDPYNDYIYVTNHGGTGTAIVEMDGEGNVQTTAGTFPGTDEAYGIIVVP